MVVVMLERLVAFPSFVYRYYKRISMIALCQVHFHNCVVCICVVQEGLLRSLFLWKRVGSSAYITDWLTSKVRKAVLYLILFLKNNRYIFSILLEGVHSSQTAISSKICTNRQSTHDSTNTIYISSWTCYWLRNGKIRGATSVNC